MKYMKKNNLRLIGSKSIIFQVDFALKIFALPVVAF